MAHELPGFGKAFKSSVRKHYPAIFGLGGFGEVLPRKENRVTLDPEVKDAWGVPVLRFDYRFSDNELRMAKDMADSLEEMLHAAGAENVKINREPLPPGWSIHEIGTARMGNDPKASVTDRYGRLHDAPNVYLADAAPFVSGGTQNTTWSILALCWRAMDHLVARRRAGELRRTVGRGNPVTHGRRDFLEKAVALATIGADPGLARPRGSRCPRASRRTPESGSRLDAAQGAALPDRFRWPRTAGFDGIEMQTVTDAHEAEEIRDASARTGLRDSLGDERRPLAFPLSSGDPEVVARSIQGMETSLGNAKLWGADAVLLVPAVVNAATSYQRGLDPVAEGHPRAPAPDGARARVVIAVEEVWNKFLLSPLEFARYVDDFESPWLKAYFDVGNVVFYGFPQDWIRALGPRIVEVHLKDFSLDRADGRFHWKNLGEGDIDWPAVRKALSEIGYDGWVTTEIAGGDATYLKDVVTRVDRFLAGDKPV